MSTLLCNTSQIHTNTSIKEYVNAVKLESLAGDIMVN